MATDERTGPWRRRERWGPEREDAHETAWQTGPEWAPAEGSRGPASAPFGGIGGLRPMGDDDYRGMSDYPPGEYGGIGPRGWTPSSERILDEVCQMLADEAYLDASDIEVQVRDCEITLTGTVPTRDQKRIADNIAHLTRGVRDVHNRLTIQGRRHRPVDVNRPE